jgi:ATP-dependent Clp protease ATP-binding subunit ClpA
MFEKFTDRARRIIVLAQEEARLLGNNYIGIEHLLLALLREPDSVAGEAMMACEVSFSRVRARIEEHLGDGGVSPQIRLPFTPSAKRALEGTVREALRLGDNFVGTGHLLLSLVRLPNPFGDEVKTYLGVDAASLEQHIRAIGLQHRERLHMAGPTAQSVRPLATAAAIAIPRRARALADRQPTASQHFLLGILDDPSSLAARVLDALGVDRAAVERKIDELPPDNSSTEDE